MKKSKVKFRHELHMALDGLGVPFDLITESLRQGARRLRDDEKVFAQEKRRITAVLERDPDRMTYATPAALAAMAEDRLRRAGDYDQALAALTGDEDDNDG